MQATRPSLVQAYRIVFALLTFVTVAYQFWQRTSVPDFRPANFFSFFTIQSNLFAACVFLWSASQPVHAPDLRRDLVRGAAVTYLTITGVVYGLLLSGYQVELQTTIPWVDTVLHRVMPLILIIDWLLNPPYHRLNVPRALVWLLYPLLYGIYSLIRGSLVGWYPYPFLDPARSGGYAGVALYAVGIAIGGLVFVWLVVLSGNRLRLIATSTSSPQDPLTHAR